jgi:transposase
VEQLDYNFLFRWFVRMGTNEEIWDHSSFTQNRDRLLSGDVAHRFFAAVLDQAKAGNLTSDEHFARVGSGL